jgi:hypothetical protein
MKTWPIALPPPCCRAPENRNETTSKYAPGGGCTWLIGKHNYFTAGAAKKRLRNLREQSSWSILAFRGNREMTAMRRF